MCGAYLDARGAAEHGFNGRLELCVLHVIRVVQEQRKLLVVGRHAHDQLIETALALDALSDRLLELWLLEVFP